MIASGGYREQLSGRIERRSHSGTRMGRPLIGFAGAKKKRRIVNSFTLALPAPLHNAIALIVFLVLCSRPAKTARISIATRAMRSSQSSAYEKTKA